MKWHWKLGRFADIDVNLHASFVLILAYVAWRHWELGPMGILEGLFFVVALFACVVLHEFGHALAARKFGIKTRDITLYPIGGVARLERMPEKPGQELWVAVAGPLVNGGIAAALFVVLLVSHAFLPFAEVSITAGPFVERLLIANLFLGLFNLIPAFPMDGGRVLRAFLAMKLDYARATSIAAAIGQGLALVLGLIGLTGNPMLVFIAFFVWMGASQEAGMVQMKSALAGILVRQAMLTDFRDLSPTESLGRAAELVLQGSQQDFPVRDGNTVIGILTRSDLVQALSQGPETGEVRTAMRREFLVSEESEMLESLFTRLQESECHTVPVLRAGALVGLVTSENIGEFLMIQSARQARIPQSA